jgi:hypothetical protein
MSDAQDTALSHYTMLSDTNNTSGSITGAMRKQDGTRNIEIADALTHELPMWNETTSGQHQRRTAQHSNKRNCDQQLGADDSDVELAAIGSLIEREEPMIVYWKNPSHRVKFHLSLWIAVVVISLTIGLIQIVRYADSRSHPIIQQTVNTEETIAFPRVTICQFRQPIIWNMTVGVRICCIALRCVLAVVFLLLRSCCRVLAVVFLLLCCVVLCCVVLCCVVLCCVVLCCAVLCCVVLCCVVLCCVVLCCVVSFDFFFLLIRFYLFPSIP